MRFGWAMSPFAMHLARPAWGIAAQPGSGVLELARRRRKRAPGIAHVLCQKHASRLIVAHTEEGPMVWARGRCPFTEVGKLALDPAADLARLRSCGMGAALAALCV